MENIVKLGEGGVMGVMLGNESKSGVLITEVVPHAAADKSGHASGRHYSKN